MSDRTEKAVELFKSGFNCSQSVFAAFADVYGIDRTTALKVSAGLGGGVGRSREVCGAVCAAAMLTGLSCGATEGGDSEGKQRCYETVREIMDEFRKTNPSVVCRELLGLEGGNIPAAKPDERTPAYYKKRPCVQIVEDAARAVEKVLLKESE